MNQPGRLSYTLGRLGLREKGGLATVTLSLLAFKPRCLILAAEPPPSSPGLPRLGGSWEGVFPRLQGWKGTQCPQLPAWDSLTETPRLGSGKKGHWPAGPRPASPAQPSPLRRRGREEGQAPPAQPAMSNLIKQETRKQGLQPDKAPAEHLELLFPFFPLQTFPDTCSGASRTPGPGRGSHEIWFSCAREWPAS